jgi:hypothetical protein
MVCPVLVYQDVVYQQDAWTAVTSRCRPGKITITYAKAQDCAHIQPEGP